jgi:hypothetical protein
MDKSTMVQTEIVREISAFKQQPDTTSLIASAGAAGW